MLSLGIRTGGIVTEDKPSLFKLKLLSHKTAVQSQDMSDVVTKKHAPDQLRWATGFGFEIGGPILEDVITSEKVTVVKKESSIILWTVDKTRRQILIAATGHSIRLPYSTQLVTLLEKLARGETVTLSPASVNKKKYLFSETFCDKRCEQAERKRTTKQDARALLVNWLMRVYAVFVVS
jgi:hypothetical protein